MIQYGAIVKLNGVGLDYRFRTGLDSPYPSCAAEEEQYEGDDDEDPPAGHVGLCVWKERLRARMHHGEVVLARAEVGLSQGLVRVPKGVVRTAEVESSMSM